MSKSQTSQIPPLAILLRRYFVSGFVVFTFAAYAIYDRLVGGNTSSDLVIPNKVSTQVQPDMAESNIALVSAPLSPKPQSPTSEPPAAPNVAPVNPTPVPATATDVPTDIPPTATALPTATPAGQYRDGTYDGPITDAFYGNVQVRAVVQGGKIVDVQFLDYPQDRRTSQRINSIAMPYLTQEAIQVQSAYINIISGATLTSYAFAQSLDSALSQARTGL